MAREIKNITIFGAGLMGNGLAQVFASDENANIIVKDIKLSEKPSQVLEDNLNTLISKDAMTREKADSILRRVKYTTDMEEALKDADFIIECIFENMELKQNLFRDIEPLCKPDAIFATNTSVMSITEIASKVKDKSRVVGTHFWNPPYLIPLVEVVKGNETSEEVFEDTYNYLRKIGKKAVKCMKDVPGFIANRLQHAIWREALSIVEKGIADAETVDEALRYGPGLRWPILGILENADMIGLDLSLNIQEYIVPHLEDSHSASSLLKKHVADGNLGFKTGKGYQTWNEEEIKASRKRLNEYLIDVTKDLK